ncbi:hypothetical protein HK098_001048, partial [Nowakowskiella sp. JEL0407]
MLCYFGLLLEEPLRTGMIKVNLSCYAEKILAAEYMHAENLANGSIEKADVQISPAKQREMETSRNYKVFRELKDLIWEHFLEQPNLSARIGRFVEVIISTVTPYSIEKYGWCPVAEWQLCELYPLHVNSISRNVFLIQTALRTTVDIDAELALRKLLDRHQTTGPFGIQLNNENIAVTPMIPKILRKVIFSPEFPCQIDGEVERDAEILSAEVGFKKLMFNDYIADLNTKVYNHFEHLCSRIVSRLMDDYLRTVLRDIAKNAADQERNQTNLILASEYLSVPDQQPAKAENLLLQSLHSHPDNFEARINLIKAYELQKKYKAALGQIERLLTEIPKSLELAYKCADLNLKLAEECNSGTALTHVEKCITILQSTREYSEEKLTEQALVLILKGITPISLLREKLVGLASQEETFCVPEFHLLLLQCLNLDANKVFTHDLPWIGFVKDNLKTICKGYLPAAESEELDFRVYFELYIYYIYALLCLESDEKNKDWEKTTNMAIRDLEAAIDDSDWAFPLKSNAAKVKYSQMRQEFVAQARFMRSLLIFKDIQSQSSSWDPHSEIYHKNLHRPKLPDTRETKEIRELQSHRLSRSLHLLLATTISFDSKWLFTKKPDEVISHLNENDVIDAVTTLQLPSVELSQPDKYVNQPKHVASALKWGLKDGGLLDVDLNTLTNDPWNLTKVVTIAAWHLENGTLRTWLKKIFTRLQDRPSLYDAMQTGLQTTITYADLEVFLLVLLIHRHNWSVNMYRAKTLGRVLFYSDLFWKPALTQVEFWRTALCRYGMPQEKKGLEDIQRFPHRLYYAKSIMSNELFVKAIYEIRGLVRSPIKPNEKRNFKHILFSIVGCIYSEMVEKYRLDRIEEAIYYLRLVNQNVWNTPVKWSGEFKVSSSIIFQEFLVISEYGTATKKISDFLDTMMLRKQKRSTYSTTSPKTTNDNSDLQPKTIPKSPRGFKECSSSFSVLNAKKENTLAASGSMPKPSAQLPFLNRAFLSPSVPQIQLSDDRQQTSTPIKFTSLAQSSTASLPLGSFQNSQAASFTYPATENVSIQNSFGFSLSSLKNDVEMKPTNNTAQYDDDFEGAFEDEPLPPTQPLVSLLGAEEKSLHNAESSKIGLSTNAHLRMTMESDDEENIKPEGENIFKDFQSNQKVETIKEEPREEADAADTTMELSELAVSVSRANRQLALLESLRKEKLENTTIGSLSPTDLPSASSFSDMSFDEDDEEYLNTIKSHIASHKSPAKQVTFSLQNSISTPEKSRSLTMADLLKTPENTDGGHLKKSYLSRMNFAERELGWSPASRSHLKDKALVSNALSSYNEYGGSQMAKDGFSSPSLKT